MKQKTSVYLDDLDREAVRQVGEYYGITSDTDALCFSVRAVARVLPKQQIEGQIMTIPTPGDDDLFARKQWQVDIYTSKDQTVPHTFYGVTMKSLKEQVYEWLLTAHPTYMQSKSGFVKEGKGWRPHYTEHDESAYKEFCSRGLDIKKGPEYVESGFIDGKFLLEYVKTTTQYRDVDLVNQMLQRGWHVLALDKVGVDRDETTYYVLGHVEEGAT